MAANATTPTKIKKLSPGELQILWADGHETRHLAPLLRGLCPCASCQDEMTGKRMILPMHIPDSLEFKKIELVGQYAGAIAEYTRFLELVPGATHLFEEPGTLEQVAEHALAWFQQHFHPAPPAGTGARTKEHAR